MIDKKMLDRVKELSQYRLVDERPVEEMNSYGMVLEHKKSGARIFLMSCEDDNKVFSIGFRTPPQDSTGLPHILEHSVLEGSESFRKRSLCRAGKGFFKHIFKCNDLSG